MTRSLLAVLLLLAQAVAPQPPSPSDDTGQIRGRVTDKETGQPLPYAQVEMWDRTQNVGRSATADDAGVYRFLRLPPGKYTGAAWGGPYRTTHDFQEVNSPPPTPIELRKGEVREINVALRRTRTIPVRVVDEFGDPLSDVSLRVFRAPGINAVASPFHQRTDDHGRIRVFGLTAGRYVLCAEPFGSAGTQRVKDAPRERFLRTCYPSAANEADAEPLTVGSGPIDEVEIRMRRGRTFTVSGIVLDASGAPASGANLGLSVFTANSSGGSGGFRVEPDGRFRIDGVHPGAYGLEASVGGPDRPQERRAREAALIPLRVDSDVTDLVVTLSKGVDVPGRILLEDPTQTLPEPQGSGFMITARLAGDFLSGTGSGLYAYSRADRTFTLTGIFGRRTLDFANVPPGFYVKQVRYRGNDVIDTPIDFARGGDAGSLEVVLSTRGATVTGRVLDDLANPARGAFVWLLRADGDAAIDMAGEASTSENGEFRFGPLRPGEYVAVAFASRVPRFERADRARAAKLASLGERVRLTEFDERSIDLRVIKEEPR